MIKSIKLKNGRQIGPQFPSYIIAEIGSNHDGSLEKALNLITLAKKAGADAAKFQSFKAETLTNYYTKKNHTWEKEPAFEILKKLEVPLDWHEKLQKHALNEGIHFLSTPFDNERLQLLVSLEVPLIKIASGDLTNKDLLTLAAHSKIPVVISTGAAFLDEVKTSFNLLKKAQAKDIAILQCVSCYPAKVEHANVLAMKAMQEEFQVPVGYSDHTPGSLVALAAVAIGASIIEKHFTDDSTLLGPDHAHSLNVQEFSSLVTSIRSLETALGSGIKQPIMEEMEERVMARRALYAAKQIPAGAKITKEMIKLVRHYFDEGISDSPDIIIGRTVKKEIKEHELIRMDHLK